MSNHKKIIISLVTLSVVFFTMIGGFAGWFFQGEDSTLGATTIHNANPPRPTNGVNGVTPIWNRLGEHEIELIEFLQVKFKKDSGGIGMTQTYYFDDGLYMAHPGDTLVIGSSKGRKRYLVGRSPGILALQKSGDVR
jgi:hypothetical protein